MVNGIATRSLGPGDGGSISDAELCALLGARYEDLNAGTFEGEIKISEPATREECSAATVDASRQDPSYTLKKPDRQAESNRD
jgi:hypothetical protein